MKSSEHMNRTIFRSAVFSEVDLKKEKLPGHNEE